MRSVVTHIGMGSGDSLWTCSKDGPTQQCEHIKQAQSYLNELGLESDPINQSLVIGKFVIALIFWI